MNNNGILDLMNGLVELSKDPRIDSAMSGVQKGMNDTPKEIITKMVRCLCLLHWSGVFNETQR